MSDSLPKALFSREEFDKVLLQLKNGLYLFNEFETLFEQGTKDGLLKHSGSDFFGLVQHCLWDSLILYIARLFDPSQTQGQSNLSIPFLLEGCENCNPKLKDWKQTYVNLREKAKSLINYRNKHIGHKDLKAIFNRTHKLEMSPNDVWGLMNDLWFLLKEINDYYFKDHRLFIPKRLPSALQGAKRTLLQLEKARRYDDWRKQQTRKKVINNELARLIDAKPEES